MKASAYPRRTVESRFAPGRSTIPAYVRWVGLLLLGVVLGACQGRKLGFVGTTYLESDPAAPLDAPSGIDRTPLGCPADDGPLAMVQVASGDAYAEDERTRELAATWAKRVRSAAQRLELVAGLRFPAGVAPRVVLQPLGNEALPWMIRTEVREGRRGPVIQVNMEVLAARRAEPDRLLLQALAEAVFVDAAARRAPVPPWVVRAAVIVGGGDLSDRLLVLKRTADREGPAAVLVDPGDPNAAEATAAAAILVLLQGGDPDALRRFLAFSAEGDDPDALLVRTLREASGRWAGIGRNLLQERLADVDASPWQTLARAREALDESGREGMEAEFGGRVPFEIETEVRVLRARAYSDEGDYAAARELLSNLTDEDWQRVQDASAALRLWIRAEEAQGGDPALASRLLDRWRRDFPRARTAVEGAAPGATDERLLEADLGEISTHLRRLLAEHRSGAARRFLEALGDRATAPELDAVSREVARAELEPPSESVQANAVRVRAWRQHPDEGRAAIVRDGGAAAADALLLFLPAQAGGERTTAVRLLGEAGGPGRAVRLLSPSWSMAPSLLAGDVDALAGVAGLGELRIWVEGLAADALARTDADALWARLHMGLDPEWLQTHPGVLRGLRSATYAVRRAAFDEAVAGGQVSPDLVARGLADPAVLLRAEAALVAGRRGFAALTRLALQDEAWIVRQAACTTAVTALGPEARSLLLGVFQGDPAPQVRLAAAKALLGLAREGDLGLLEVLTQSLADPDGPVRDELTAGLAALPPEHVLPAVARSLASEVARACPREEVLARLFQVYRRTAGWDPGYFPGISEEGLQQVLRRAYAAARRVAEAGTTVGAR